MKTIEHPTLGQLCLLMIPVFVAYAVIFITKTIPTWTIVMGIASVAVFAIAATYFCVRQKCYTQLIRVYIVILMWGFTFYGTCSISSMNKRDNQEKVSPTLTETPHSDSGK